MHFEAKNKGAGRAWASQAKHMIAASYLTETRLNCAPCNILESMEPLKAEVDKQQVGFYYQLMTTASD